MQDAVLPQTCITCGVWVPVGSQPTCGPYRERLAAIMRVSYCPHCGRTMPRAAIDERNCARCRRESFWNVAGVARVGTYEPRVRRLITGLKYGGHERNAEMAGDLLAKAIDARGWAGELDYLVPVPMHWLRRWQRPCDHAWLLAAAISRRLGLPVLRAVRRTKHTPSQTRVMSRNQRFENVKGCFEPQRRAERRLGGKRVCIIDNLLATGATVHEVSKALRRAGAGRIYAALIGRTVLVGDDQATAADDGLG